MTDYDLDTQFQKAFEKASNMTEGLPQDVMLRLYAYYKQATSGYSKGESFQEPQDLRNAFKMNAWMQVRHLSPDEAKKLYIEIVNSLIP
ncbi:MULTISPECIES: acyl-CoA-binding protein [Flavobacterium]|uniref:acyl-CoA-binding protein n=1 Tax=Flavobacterium TaxID=237 RepID=UPI000968C34E|nr:MULTISPECIES: acyl-CoA-binding protein [Flavobacterium]MBN9285753.1 acyl-CoA-binding protein [Flavobacterium sp.]OJV70366.1 MAG: phosphatidylserine decarboxylase [Flavobacterium sp. 40-81]